MFKKIFSNALLSVVFVLFLGCGQENSQAQIEEVEMPSLREVGESFNFSVISDLNGSYGSTTYSPDLDKAINSIISKNGTSDEVSLVLSTGDMVAGQKTGLNYKAMWSAFHAKVTAKLNQAGIAFAPSPGNHDASLGSSYQVERNEYISTFQNRRPSVLLNLARETFSAQIKVLEGSTFPLYYAFTFKGGLFISLDATSVGPITVTQYKFLEKTLIQNNNAKFKIVFGHMPLYPFAFSRAHEFMAKGNTTFYKDFENLLEKYKVDYFLSGHHHAYYPGHRKGYVNYVSVPLLGSGARAILSPGNKIISKSAFLNFSYNSETGLNFKAIDAKKLTEVSIASLPETVSVPSTNATNCTGCAEMPSKFFIKPSLRTLYFRIDK